jgi:hypothetical protein
MHLTGGIADGLFALSTIDAFGTTKTPFALVLTGFHTLRIHDAIARLRFVPFKHTNLFSQGSVQTFPKTHFEPSPPVTVYGAPGWEANGLGSPFDAVVEHVAAQTRQVLKMGQKEKRIENTRVIADSASKGLEGRHKRFKDADLVFAKISWIRQRRNFKPTALRLV